jgi:hypothetical protein
MKNEESIDYANLGGFESGTKHHDEWSCLNLRGFGQNASILNMKKELIS